MLFYSRTSILSLRWLALAGIFFTSVAFAESILSLCDDQHPEVCRARTMFERLTGATILPQDPRLSQMAEWIKKNELEKAAAIATDDDNFINVKVRDFVSDWGSRDETKYTEFSDLHALVLGIIRDDTDGREILTADYQYAAGDFALKNMDVHWWEPQLDPVTKLPVLDSQGKQIPVFTTTPNAPVYYFAAGTSPLYPDLFPPAPFNDRHWRQLESYRVNYKAVLRKTPTLGKTAYAVLDLYRNEGTSDATAIRTNPIREWGIPKGQEAGVLTSFTWGREHYLAGTNRRPLEYAFKVFLCRSLLEVADSNVPDHRIRQDVDRKPGGDPTVYQTNCRGCHGGLDALAGGFAMFNFSTWIRWKDTMSLTQFKMTQNSQVYPSGFMTVDDSWENLFTEHSNQKLGWRGKTSGQGIRELASMLANSRAFSACMAERVFETTCGRPLNRITEEEKISNLADDFEESGYKFKKLFQKAVVLPECR